MRISSIAFLATSLALFVPHALQAQEHGSVSGVTGFTVAQSSPISTLESAVSSGAGSNLNFGGRVAFTLAPGFEAVGEVGRIGNVLPTLVDSTLAFSRVDLRASAIYGEGGMRAFLGSGSAVHPYVEATGGFAHLSLRAVGFNATADDLLALGLGLTNSTSPVAGLGGGVAFTSGRLMLDAGYRYKKIFARDFVTTIFGSGQDLTSHQVVFGAGVRF
jgi:opacity protein-like surface antigen